MEFVNSGLVAPAQVWVLTDQQLATLKKSGIGFDQLSELPLHLDRIPESDVIDIAVTQYRAYMKLKMLSSDCFEKFDDDYKDILLSKIKSEQDRLSKTEHIKELNAYSKFYVHNTPNVVVVVLVDAATSTNYISELCASFTELHVGSFPEAVLKALYHVYGYTYLHLKECQPKAGVGVLSLAKVYRALT